jgi:hypothetical protein
VSSIKSLSFPTRHLTSALPDRTVVIAEEDGYLGASLFIGFTLIIGSCMTFAPVFYHRAVNRWRNRGGMPATLDPGPEVEEGKREAVPAASRV